MEVPIRKNHIIFFSGGKASFATADFVKKKYPGDNILLYFTDPQWEHKDSYRFIYEGADKLELPLLVHSTGLSPMQLMFEKKLVYNNRLGDCSKLLKMRVAADYLKKGIEPNIQNWRNANFLKQDDFITGATLYFGIDYKEMHREKAILKNWLPFQVEMPLIHNFVRVDDVLKEYGIRQPDLYKLGFSHSNCSGRCVKAGMGHFRNLKKTMPEVFKKLMEEEYHLYMCVSAYRYIIDNTVPDEDRIPLHVQEMMLQELDDAYRDYFYGRADKPKLYIHPSASASARYMKIRKYSFMKRQGNSLVENSNNTIDAEEETVALDRQEMMDLELYDEYEEDGASLTKYRYASVPYTLRDFNNDEETKPDQIDLFDIGGCGCFLDFENQTV
ncbi:phosphoadenosine phosphosulfate reductase family protein [Paenibacillus periandrae]|uniref:phosphoadenosine phosphosulfate reductase domain-containing protein n=1 Tax=Paenibacillus periandrae TaxID=1761741 RepID=UPI001F09E17A|nr:phosphoadenosine phosphosulfate reductase family protein [Paenibacillus periandrae]